MAAKHHKGDAPLFAWGYDPSVIEGFPILSCHDLDTVSTNIPIIVINMSGHIGYVNSKALQDANYDRTTNIKGVIKDAKGELTGELQEMEALLPLLGKHMEVDTPLLVKGLENMAILARQKGCTTISELTLGVIPHSWDALIQATSKPNYPVRLSVYPLYEVVMHTGGVDGLKKQMQSSNERLRVAGVKFVTDGSIQGYTANMKWLYYYDGSPNGLANISNEELEKGLHLLHQAGIQCAIHVNGDQALTDVLNILEKILSIFPRNDHRHRFEHCQLATQENLQRMAAFGIAANIFTNHIHYWGDFHKNHTIGPDRIQYMDPALSAKKAGVKFSLHSDSHITPLDPLKMIWVAATRRAMDTNEVLGKEECLSVADGLHAMTIGAAYLLREDEVKGSIEPGKYADFVILDHDPLAVPVDDLLKIKILGTMCSGQLFKV